MNLGVIEMVMLMLYTNDVIQSCVLLTSNKISVSQHLAWAMSSLKNLRLGAKRPNKTKYSYSRALPEKGMLVICVCFLLDDVIFLQLLLPEPFKSLFSFTN